MKKALFTRLENMNMRNASVGALTMTMAAFASAGTTGAEFQGFYDLMVGWTSGYLGKGLALGAFLLGAALGMVKGTMVPALVGIGFAIMFSVGPGVITGMLAATI